uniref:Rho-GAP domain-containing protein n=1 Tax=Strigamia maritima TaxID=126957 RepID=T1IH04_STRMM
MNKSRREEMKKQFFRVKQLADQTFARAEKTEVLSEDLINVEKKVDLIKLTCDKVSKKLQACLQGQGTDGVALDKRLKKLPGMQLSNCMSETSIGFGDQSVLGNVLHMCGTVEKQLSNELLDYEVEMERLVINKQLEILDNDVPSISKQKKHLAKLVLDMDSARTRYQTAARHSLQAAGTAKVDVIKDEMDDASLKVEQCRDTLAAEMFTLISRECEMAQHLSYLVKCQADYHKKSLHILENYQQQIEDEISSYHSQPMYGTSLEEHLKLTDRTIALPIEACACFLLECGIDEEGLFRIAGGSSKVKKLTAAFDANLIGIIDMNDYTKDPHSVASALKSYLRNLPNPLLTHELYSEWMQATRITDIDARLQALWVVLRKLPEPYMANLRYLIKFLSHLAANHEVNKMSSQNIALVMGPNLLWAPDDAAIMNMTMANAFSTIADHLITQADWFFPGEVEFFVSSPPPPKSPYEGGFVTATEMRLSGSNGDLDYSVNGPNENSASNNSSPQSGASPKTLRRSKKPAPPIPSIVTVRERPQPAERSSIIETRVSSDHVKVPLERKKSTPTEVTPPVVITAPVAAIRSQVAEKPMIPEKPNLEKRTSVELSKSPVPMVESSEIQRVPPSPDEESPIAVRRSRQSPSPADRFDYYRPEWYGSLDSEPSNSPPRVHRKRLSKRNSMRPNTSDTESDVTQSSAEDLRHMPVPDDAKRKIETLDETTTPMMSGSRTFELSKLKESLQAQRSVTPERPVKPPRSSESELLPDRTVGNGREMGEPVKPRRPAKPPDFPARPSSVVLEKPERPEKPPERPEKPPQFAEKLPERPLIPPKDKSLSPVNLGVQPEKMQSIKYTLVVGAKSADGNQQDAHMPRSTVSGSPVAPRRPPRPQPPPPLKKMSSSEDTHLLIYAHFY